MLMALVELRGYTVAVRIIDDYGAASGSMWKPCCGVAVETGFFLIFSENGDGPVKLLHCCASPFTTIIIIPMTRVFIIISMTIPIVTTSLQHYILITLIIVFIISIMIVFVIKKAIHA
ncbi:unnamed protein product [Lota lota]